MLCEECGKNNAEVIIKTVINGQITQRQLCRECAQNLKLPGLQNILAGALGNAPAVASDKGPKCPACGLPFSVYASRGCLGCVKCYDFFSSLLSKNLPSLYEQLPYIGKTPDPNLRTIRKEIRLVTEKMNDASDREDYEEAHFCFESIKRMCMSGEMEADACESK